MEFFCLLSSFHFKAVFSSLFLYVSIFNLLVLVILDSENKYHILPGLCWQIINIKKILFSTIISPFIISGFAISISFSFLSFITLMIFFCQIEVETLAYKLCCFPVKPLLKTKLLKFLYKTYSISVRIHNINMEYVDELDLD